jgi:hypothetical protein
VITDRVRTRTLIADARAGLGSESDGKRDLEPAERWLATH